MGARVDPIPDSRWYSDRPREHPGPRKGRKSPGKEASPPEPEEPASPAEDYYTPSKPGEEA